MPRTAAALTLVLSTVFVLLHDDAWGQPTAIDPEFEIVVFAAIDLPRGMAVAPSGSAFPAGLYVAAEGDMCNPDPIYRVTAAGTPMLFASPPGWCQPLGIAFSGPLSPHGDYLFVSANAFSDQSDCSCSCGGSVLRIDSLGSGAGVGSTWGFAGLTATACGCGVDTLLSEPEHLSFAPPSSPFGSGLFVANSGSMDGQIMIADALGTVTPHFDSVAQPFIKSVVFGDGGPFGSGLYASDTLNDELLHLATPGTVTPTLFAGTAGAMRLSTGAVFGTYIYVASGTELQRVDSLGVVTTFATGFAAPVDLEFSPGAESLYVSDYSVDTIYEVRPTHFLRGDCNADGSVDPGDAVSLLAHLFLAASADCLDACDTNDSGDASITDAFHALCHLFCQTGTPPNPPFPVCGWDSTPDSLGCSTYGFCQ